jgi:putative IMPACT (imprinted ancient) family translation regulator
MPESYKTINHACGPSEIKDKGSKFMAFAFPVRELPEAEDCLSKLKTSYHDASHIPYAVRLGEGEEQAFKYSDDGEPNGTGGIPIYQEIGRRGLFNVLVAVVRYFGGTKLGKGNLQRAFAAAARLALDAAPVQEVRICREAELIIPFAFTGDIMQVIKRLGVRVIAQDYLPDGVKLKLAIPAGGVEAFNESLIQKSGGSIKGLSL